MKDESSKSQKKIKEELKKKQGSVDFILLSAVLAIIIIGLMMVLSSSWPEAIRNPAYNGDGLYFLKRQLIFFGIGLVGMVIMAKIDFKKWKKLAVPIYLISLIVGLGVLTPIGVELNGAYRWIRLPGDILFMPSDLMKLASIIYLSAFLSARKRRIKKFVDGFLVGMAIIGIPCGIILIFQKDLGTSGALGLTLFALLFIGGARKVYLFGTAGLAVLGAFPFVIREQYRVQRILTFIDPFKDKQGGSWQIVQSLYAIGAGGLFGAGLGQSKQKYYYIPEPFSDFIFSIFAEEFGFLGVIIVIGLYMVVAWRGVVIALRAKSAFGSYLAIGLTMLIMIQTMIHIAVVSSSIPATGITMPFVSYGGTSLVVYMAIIGIILNISREEVKVK